MTIFKTYFSFTLLTTTITIHILLSYYNIQETNPTIVKLQASAVKINNSTNSLVH
jgi:hypothetical protein